MYKGLQVVSLNLYWVAGSPAVAFMGGGMAIYSFSKRFAFMMMLLPPSYPCTIIAKAFTRLYGAAMLSYSKNRRTLPKTRYIDGLNRFIYRSPERTYGNLDGIQLAHV